MLDNSLKNFSNAERTPKDRLKSIIELINKFTTSLEEPSTYLISGDALREIHEELISSFRLEKLIELLLKKIDMLERLYRYNLELSWAKKIIDTEK